MLDDASAHVLLSGLRLISNALARSSSLSHWFQSFLRHFHHTKLSPTL